MPEELELELLEELLVPLLEPVLSPVPEPFPSRPVELFPIPVFPWSSGVKPERSLNTLLLSFVNPYAVTPAAIHNTITTEIIMLELSIFPPLLEYLKKDLQYFL